VTPRGFTQSYWSVKKQPQGKENDPPQYRMCLDLRAINKQIVVSTYPMPTFNEIIESFGESPPAYLSVFDAHSGYLQLNMSPESSKLLGVESDSKTYRLKKLPCGLTSSPFVFQKFMNKLLTGYQFVFAAAYADDCMPSLVNGLVFPPHAFAPSSVTHL